MSGGLRPFHARVFSPANVTSAGPCCSPVLPCSRHGWPTLVKQGCPEVALTPGCGATFVFAESGLMLLGSTCCLNSFSSRKMKVRTCSCISWTGRLRCVQSSADASGQAQSAIFAWARLHPPLPNRCWVHHIHGWCHKLGHPKTPVMA